MIKTTTLTRIILATSIMLLTNMSCSNSEEQQRVRQSRQNRQSPMKNSMLVKQADTTKLDTIQPVKIDTNQLANVNNSTNISNNEITIPAEINNVDVNSNYVRVENTKHKNCQYYEEIDFILKSKLELYIQQQNKPIQYFSQWTLDLFDIRYTRNEVIEYYENKINQELEIMIKNTKFNFKNVDVNKPIISSK